MAKVGLDNFVKTISLRELHDQNGRLRKIHQKEVKDIPRGACFDKYRIMYVPYGPYFYRRVNDQRLILYKRGNQRRVKIRDRRNDQYDVELTTTNGLTLLNKLIIQRVFSVINYVRKFSVMCSTVSFYKDYLLEMK